MNKVYINELPSGRFEIWLTEWIDNECFRITTLRPFKWVVYNLDNILTEKQEINFMNGKNSFFINTSKL